jgi:hypothetical protein
VTAIPDLTAWHASNSAWLAAAVEWLRLLLAHHAASAAQPQVLPAETPTQEDEPWWRFGRRATDSPLRPPSLPPAAFEVTREQVDEAAARMAALEDNDPPPAMTLLARRMNLSSFERDVLLLAVAMELDTRIAGLCARAHGDAALAYPTFGLAFALFDGAAEEDDPRSHWDGRSPAGALRYWRLIEVQQSFTQPLLLSPLRADERIVDFIKGMSELDERVAPLLTIIEHVHDSLPSSQAAAVREIERELVRDESDPRPVQLLGRDPESKQLVASHVAHRRGLRLYRISAELLPQQPAELETLVRLWVRETLLLRVALYVDASDVDRAADAHAAPLKRFLARLRGVVFVDAKETWPVPRGSHSLDVGKPTPAEQRALWSETLGESVGAAKLAAQYNFSAASIRRIAADAADTGGNVSFPRARSRAARTTRMRVDALAQRIDAKAKWKDIVLPDDELALLKQIAAHVAGRSTVYDDWGFRRQMNRGFGISALFAGESGTGKTMAAEVIANALKLTLHRIDLSSVVSKWVGETEKNLQQLFNAADDANGILFFDEADALFGKRTEVQQSQDRFANIEINFLLQRLESYRGLAILATNMKTALDAAFLRRLRFVVDFPFPNAELRRQIWQRAFPAKVPKQGLELDRLAKLNLTGGSIHNVALASSFAAAEAGTPVTMPIVLEAARMELRKLEKPIFPSDFEWEEAAAS